VTLKTGVEKSEALKKELVAHVRTLIGPIATRRNSSGPMVCQDPERQDHAGES